MNSIRVGTRESELALAQTQIVIDKIVEKHPDLTFQIIKMKTKGDLILDKRLDKIGGKGLFIKELELALLNNEIDIAVHSLKDMPAEITEGLKISVVSEREDPRDVLISLNGEGLGELPRGAIIGTSSRRREAQIKAMRPDFEIKTLRGNVNTRLDKLQRGEYDAIILASAGLKRLGKKDRITSFLDSKEFIPAVGQGVLAIETRDENDMPFLKDSIHCEKTWIEISAERAFLSFLNGGCSIPVGAHAIVCGDNIEMVGFLADENLKIFTAKLIGRCEDAEELGIEVAKKILKYRGGEL